MIGGPPAARWRIAAAGLADAALGVIAWSLAAMWLAIAVVGTRRRPLDTLDSVVLTLAVLFLGAALHVVYHTVLVGGCGQTFGRMWLGIAVVRSDGGPAGYGRALLRCLGGGLCLLTFGLGRLPVLLTRERRGLPDLVAGTRPVSVSAPDPPAAVVPPVPAWPVPPV